MQNDISYYHISICNFLRACLYVYMLHNLQSHAYSSQTDSQLTMIGSNIFSFVCRTVFLLSFSIYIALSFHIYRNTHPNVDPQKQFITLAELFRFKDKNSG